MAETGGPSTHPPIDENQIAVATAHVGMVLATLQRLGVTAGVRDESRELGLTLLVLPDDQVRQAARPGAGDALRDLLAQLYQDFSSRFGGWVPTLGRNRTVKPVTGAHNIGGGDACAPTLAAGTLLPARHGEPGYGVRIGIADTALYQHPWLAGAYQAAPSSFLEDLGKSPDFSAGHATFVAGLILQQAPGATVEARRVLGDDGQADSWDVAKKLVRFAGSGLDVLNLSFGCLTEDNQAPLVLTTALKRLGSRVVVVAAAGNHGADPDDHASPMWPAALDDVVAVATMDGQGNRPDWSPDPSLPWVDLNAPGENVTSTYLNGDVDLTAVHRPAANFDGYAKWSGTSFSAAHVSGAIASRVIPGEFGPAAALAEIRARAEMKEPQPSGQPVPWIG